MVIEIIKNLAPGIKHELTEGYWIMSNIFFQFAASAYISSLVFDVCYVKHNNVFFHLLSYIHFPKQYAVMACFYFSILLLVRQMLLHQDVLIPIHAIPPTHLSRSGTSTFVCQANWNKQTCVCASFMDTT